MKRCAPLPQRTSHAPCRSKPHQAAAQHPHARGLGQVHALPTSWHPHPNPKPSPSPNPNPYQVHAFPTSWYRIFPSMFTNAHEALQELDPDKFVTPLDAIIRDFLRFRESHNPLAGYA